jgi:hypothetical protein
MSRKASFDTITCLYEEVRLLDEEIKYLLKKGYRSAISILTSYNNCKLDKLQDDVLFPEGCVQLLIRLVQYLQWKQDTDGNLQSLTADSAFFETFDPTKVKVQAPQQSTVPSSTFVKQGNTTVSV